MNKSIAILSLIIISTTALFAGDSEQQKKTKSASTATLQQTANKGGTGGLGNTNSTSAAASGVSFVNSSGDTLMQIRDNGNVIIGSAVANGNAVLDIDALNNDKGILIPRLTTTQRTAMVGLSAADQGLALYDENTASFWYWNSTQWVEIGSGSDNLGDHTATQTLNLNGNDISGADTVTAIAFIGDGSGLTGLPSSGWSLTGNSGTTPGANFLGTTDNQALEIRVNGARAGRIEPDATSPNVVFGFSGNNASASGATIGGGGKNGAVNSVTADFGTVGGGSRNIASGFGTTVGGGQSNTASDLYDTVSGGASNTVDGGYATVGGGRTNTASGFSTTVDGGQFNTASGSWATVGGGVDNTSSGFYAIIPGGRLNQAAGAYSFAAGRRAKINAAHDGAFLFADQNDLDFNSLAANEFAARATGGVRFVTAIDGSGNPMQTVSIDNAGTVTAVAFLGDGSGLTGISGDDLGSHTAMQTLNLNGNYLSGDGDSEGVFVDDDGNVGIGTTTPGARLEVNGGNVIVDNGANSRIKYQDGATLLSEIGIFDTGKLFIANKQNGDIAFETNAVERMIIDNAGNVSIGNTDPMTELHVSGSHNGFGGTPTDNVAYFHNTNTGSSADVLLLKIGTTGDPGLGTNFISFQDGDGDALGAIEGNGSGGVTNASQGSDFAEYIPKLNPNEELQPGDVVGVFGGQISKLTAGAERVMAISTAPNVVGNDPMNETERAKMGKVGFIGQVPVKVRGKVGKSDYIIASGLEDGTAIAVSSEDLQPEHSHLLIGRAWENANGGLNMVNTVVGLQEAASTNKALIRRIETQQAEIETQRTKIEALEAKVAKVALLEKQLAAVMQKLESNSSGRSAMFIEKDKSN